MSKSVIAKNVVMWQFLIQIGIFCKTDSSTAVGMTEFTIFTDAIYLLAASTTEHLAGIVMLSSAIEVPSYEVKTNGILQPSGILTVTLSVERL